MKKLLTFLISFLLVVMVVACTENVSAIGGDDIDDSNPIIDSVDDPQPIELNPVVVDPDPEPVVAPDPEPEPEPQIDPNEQLTWDYLEVDEAWLKSYGGVGLKRDGKLYSLCDETMPESFNRTGMGFKIYEQSYIGACGDWGDDNLIMDDRFVIPCVNGSSDDVCWYGEAIDSLKLVPMHLKGYTVPVMQDWNICNNLYIYDKREFPTNDVTVIYDYKSKSTRLIDINGNDVFSSFRELNHGETYTLKWNDGTEREESFEAFWRYYEPTGEETITVASIPTDDSQVCKLNFSSIPSGLYFIVECYGMVEIKND